ncbi:hypothetical protein BMS3Abin04_00448 [bacterium BMS3Abin04]|nr:hypothetical protein BMS3Abin04_00448 [bacterium BMS3Abin04]
MEPEPKLYEKYLHEIWKRQSFTGQLNTYKNEPIRTIDIGTHNLSDAGPDFKHSRVQIGSLTYVGDIEIDLDYTDWKKHGHNIDSKYNKVILHITLTNRFKQHYVFTKAGRKVPTISISELIEDTEIERISKKTHPNNNNNKLKCFDLNDDTSYKIKKNFIINLGIERFKKKSTKIYSRAKELVFINELKLKEPVIKYELTEQFNNRTFSHEDFNNRNIWKQLFYELIFEALGYSKNKSPMLKLARYADINFMQSLGEDDDLLTRIESSLFKISGLLPDVENTSDGELTEYERGLFGNWQKIKEIYDSKYLNETQWNFLNHRPQNFPTIRIAGGARLLRDLLENNLITKIIKKFEEIRNDKVLINSLRSIFIIKTDNYWSDHYVFSKPSKIKIKYFIGASRADEIVINVVLPFISVYFDIFGKQVLSKRVLKIYQMYTQKSDNKIVRQVAESIGLEGYKKRTIFSQGMIELFRNYCSKNKCLECEIGKIVFN